MKNIVNNVTPEQAYQLTLYSSFRIQIIDVRTPLEYQAGHITGAINIDYNAPDFKTKIDKLDKTAVYLVYCHSGNRSAAASKVMAENGFKYINNATKGFTDLVAAGFTTEH
jgi:phage shock protein E